MQEETPNGKGLRKYAANVSFVLLSHPPEKRCRVPFLKGELGFLDHQSVKQAAYCLPDLPMHRRMAAAHEVCDRVSSAEGLPTP
jgi:hypothetical protein